MNDACLGIIQRAEVNLRKSRDQTSQGPAGRGRAHPLGWSVVQHLRLHACSCTTVGQRPCITSVLQTAIPTRRLERGRAVGCGCEGKGGRVGCGYDCWLRRATAIRNPECQQQCGVAVRSDDLWPGVSEASCSPGRSKSSPKVLARTSPSCRCMAALDCLTMAATIPRGGKKASESRRRTPCAMVCRPGAKWTVHRGLMGDYGLRFVHGRLL